MRVVLRWTVGFVLATLAIWVVGAFCVDDTLPPTWNEQIGAYFSSGDRTLRSEGWGTVHFREDGLLGAETPLSVSQPCVVFYGDSYVASFSVGDTDALYSQFTELAHRAGRPWRGVGVAQNGRDLSHHVHLLPFYAKRIPDCLVHVFVISASDVIPNGKTLVSNSAEPCRFVPGELSHPILGPIVGRWRLQAFSTIVRTTKAALRDLRFRPGPLVESTGAKKAAEPTSTAYPDFWDTLLSTLKQRTQGHRVILVYHPMAPRLNHGRIDETDPFSPALRQFQALCRRHEIACLDMTPAFCEYTRRSRQFPRGFANSFPGQGHWNREGHRLVAQIVLDHLTASQTQAD